MILGQKISQLPHFGLDKNFTQKMDSITFPRLVNPNFTQKIVKK